MQGVGWGGLSLAHWGAHCGGVVSANKARKSGETFQRTHKSQEHIQHLDIHITCLVPRVPHHSPPPPMRLAKREYGGTMLLGFVPEKPPPKDLLQSSFWQGKPPPPSCPLHSKSAERQGFEDVSHLYQEFSLRCLQHNVEEDPLEGISIQWHLCSKYHVPALADFVFQLPIPLPR